MLSSLPCTPSEDTLTLVVSPVSRSWRKISRLPFVSPLTRLEAVEENATYLPSEEMEEKRLSLLPCAPAEERLTIVVFPCAAYAVGANTAIKSNTHIMFFFNKTNLFPLINMVLSFTHAS